MLRYPDTDESRIGGMDRMSCPECQNRRFFYRQNDNGEEYERLRKKRCEHEYWNEPEEKKEPERRKDEGELEAYAYVFLFSGDNYPLNGGSDVPFTFNGPIKCVRHDPNSTEIVICKSGVYQIFYAVQKVEGPGGSSIALAVNGSVDPSTSVLTDVGPGKVLLALRAGDFLTLRNNSSENIALAKAPIVGAQLTLERIDGFESGKCCENVPSVDGIARVAQR